MGWLDRLFGGERTVRDAEFAGIQYPGGSDELREMVREHLESADAGGLGGRVRGIVAPYGDYEYAGPVMAEAYAPLAERADDFDRILLIASSTRVPFRGVAVAAWDALGTPVGEIPVDVEAVEEAVGDELARPIPAAFEPAAGLELQLPFLRSTLQGVPCVPALVGDADDEAVTEFMRRLWGDETLVVVAARLSEGYTAERAVALDTETVEALESLEPSEIERERTTARCALRSLVEVAGGHGWNVRAAERATSADTAGSPDRVVGYAALHVVAE